MSMFKISTGGECPPLGSQRPSPFRFKVEHVELVGSWTVAMVRYPDATNYEGRKILVFSKDVRVMLQQAVQLDPHFCEVDALELVARFRPDAAGWKAACLLARTVSTGR